MAVPLAQELIAVLEPLARDRGLDLVTVEVVGGARRRTVRVFLGREDGIDIETIAAANEWVSSALDSVSRLAGPYTLEVSSPGIERALRTRRDFERFAGQQVVITTARPVDGRSRFTGDLVRLEGDDIVVLTDGEEHRVPFDVTERARLKVDFSEVGEGSGKLT